MKFRFVALVVASLFASMCAAAQKPPEKLYFLALSSVRGAHVEHRISDSPAKRSQQGILPANTPIQFTIDKDKMKFKLNGKKYEFLIVGTSALPSQ